MILKQGDNRRCSGFVPRDAEVRRTANDKGVCSFSIKVGDMDVGGAKEAIWQRCTVWEGSPLYDIAITIQKGDTVSVDGVVHHGSYQRNEGGEQTTVKTEDLWCDWVAIARKPTPKQYAQQQDHFEQVEDDELPFD